MRSRDRLEALAKTGGLTTRLSDAAVEEASLPALASLAASQWTGSFNPRPFDAEGALEIHRERHSDESRKPSSTSPETPSLLQFRAG